MQRENNSYLKMKNYFQDLVSKSNLVNSFAGYFRRELFSIKDRDYFSSPYLALFDYELGFTGPEQNTISTRTIGFGIIYQNVPEDDLELQYQRIDDAEYIILQFMARMKIDAANEQHFLYRAFKKEGAIVTPIELEDGGFGAEVTIEFHNNQSLKSDPENWTDDFLTC